MIALLKVPLLKPIVTATLTLSGIIVAMDPTEKVALIAAMSNIAVIVVGWLLGTKLNEIHVLINSRLTELLAQTKISSRAEGRQEGVIATEAKQAIKAEGIAEGKKDAPG